MGQETVIEWLNENSYRAYPLTEDSTRYITVNSTQVDLYQTFLDANFVYYSTMPSTISASIYYDGVGLKVAVIGLPSFSIPTGATFPYYARNSNNDLLVVGSQAASLFSYQINTLIPTLNFEPSVAIELSGTTTGVSSVTFGTHDVTTGDITLVDGVQTSIVLVDQAVQITVGRNEGLVLGCTSYFTEPDDCSSVISNINGATPTISGGTIKLIAGDHVKIFEDPQRSRIYIGLDFGPNDTCTTTPLPPTP